MAAWPVTGGYATGITTPASVLQQARQLGVRVAGTASPDNFEFVLAFGGTPVQYGPGTLVVPMARTFSFDDAQAAFAMLTSPHPPGKIALVTGW